jgi:hypothetical protein
VFGGILTVRRAIVAVVLLVLVGATVTLDVPYHIWYRLGGQPGATDGLSRSIFYRVTGDGDKTVTFATPDGDRTENMYESNTERWDRGMTMTLREYRCRQV